MTNLTSAEWAAWVQAVGSIVAIVSAALLVVLQARLQHRNDLALQRAEQHHARMETAKTLSVLAANAAKAMKHVSGQLKDRESVHTVAEGLAPCGIDEVTRINRYLAAIPLHALPHSLVTVTMIVGATVREFGEKVEMALRVHRQMDGAAFHDFFRTLGEMNASIELTCRDITTEVTRIEREALVSNESAGQLRS